MDDMMDINEQLWMAITVVQSKRVMFLFFCLERFLLPSAFTNDRNDDERNMTTQSINQSISFFCRRLNRLNRRLIRLIFCRRLLLIKAAHQRVATLILYPATSSLSLSLSVSFALVATRPSSESSSESSFIKNVLQFLVKSMRVVVVVVVVFAPHSSGYFALFFCFVFSFWTRRRHTTLSIDLKKKTKERRESPQKHHQHQHVVVVTVLFEPRNTQKEDARTKPPFREKKNGRRRDKKRSNEKER